MQAFIFDFDGTLADSERCSILATQSAFRTVGLPVPTELDIAYYMDIPIEQSFREMSTKALNEDEFHQLLSIFREAYKNLEADTLTVFPNIPQVLHKLQQLTIKCFVVSSKKSDVLLRNLQSLKIDHYIDGIIGSDYVSHYKPHPESLLLLSERYALRLENCLMIGDAIFDIQMGHSAKTKTCAVTWGSHTKEKLLKEKPTYCIGSVHELLTLI